MPKVKIHNFEKPAIQQVWFFCPGCQCDHAFTTIHPTFAPWTWNGDIEKPTFSPSLLCNKDFPASRCHSFVENGRIRFLEDCHHELKGQTVDLEEYE